MFDMWPPKEVTTYRRRTLIYRKFIKGESLTQVLIAYSTLSPGQRYFSLCLGKSSTKAHLPHSPNWESGCPVLPCVDIQHHDQLKLEVSEASSCLQGWCMPARFLSGFTHLPSPSPGGEGGKAGVWGMWDPFVRKVVSPMGCSHTDLRGPGSHRHLSRLKKDEQMFLKEWETQGGVLKTLPALGLWEHPICKIYLCVLWLCLRDQNSVIQNNDGLIHPGSLSSEHLVIISGTQ